MNNNYTTPKILENLFKKRTKANNNTYSNMTKWLLSFVFVLFFSGEGFALTITSLKTGNWNDSTTWLLTNTGTITSATNSTTVQGTGTSFTTELTVGQVIRKTDGTVIGTVSSITSNTNLVLTSNASVAVSAVSYGIQRIPTASDAVVIASNHVVTINVASVTCASIAMKSGTSTTKIILNGNTLTVSGSITMENNASSTSTEIAVGSGILNAASIQLNGSTTSRTSTISISTGTATVTGNINGVSGAPNGAKLVFTGAGTVVCGGGNFFSTGTATFTLYPGCTIELNGTAVPGSYTYNNLKLTGSGSATLSTTIVINGDLTIGGSKTITQGSTSLTIGGNLIINSGGTLTTANTVNFAVSNTSSISGTLVLNGNGNRTFTGAVAVNNGGKIKMTGSYPTALAFTNGINYSAGSILEYNSAGFSYTGGNEWPATSSPPNVIISCGASHSVTMPGSRTISEVLTLTSGNSLIVGANTLTLSGSSPSGTGTSVDASNASATVAFTNTSQITLPTAFFKSATNVNNITLNGAGGVVLQQAITIAGTLTLNNGVLTTTSAYLPSVTNTSTSAVTSTSSSSYISGPLKWRLATETTCSGGSYVFPVGKNGGYYPFTLSSYTATNPQAPTVEAFIGNTQGTPPSGSLLSTSEYWKVIYTNNTMNCAKVKLERPSDLASDKNIYYSTTLNGNYTSMGSSASTTKSSTSISTSITYTNATHFYVLGGKSCSSYSGTKTVGASGADFVSLRDAMISLNSCGYTGNIVLELQSDYDGTSATEIFPITIPSTFAGVASSSSRTITIRPASGVTKTIGGANSGGAIIYFNGSDYIEIDGNGMNDNGSMTIQNTAPAAASNRVVLLDSNASNNSIKYCTLKSDNSSTTAATAGVVFIGNGASGNNSNTISNNTITYASSATACLLVSYNTAGTNATNVVSNNNFADFTERGIWLGTGSNQATISNNSIYRHASITSGTTVGLIYIEAGNGYTITGNYIGGNAPYCGGTSGTYFTQASGANTYGLYFAGSGTNASQINGNFIKYIANNNSSAANVFGFYSTHTGSGTINFYDNEISNINQSNNSTGSTHYVYGCSFNGTSLTLNFYRNKIHKLINAASGANTYYYGCNFATNTLNCYNNFISAGTTGISSRTYTISSSSSTAYFLNNTLEMLTNMDNAYDMHCLQIITNSTTNYVYNNIFKSSASSSSNAYWNGCIYYASGVTVNHTHNYYQNNYLTTACVRTGSSTSASFATWEGSANGKSNTTLTLFSNGVVNANTTDVNGTGTNLYNANAFGSSPAITSDIIGRSRPNGAMWMGCYEGTGNIYYSNSSTADASDVTKWKTNRDDTGTSPSNFTGTGDVFVVQTGHQYQVSSNAFTGTSGGYIQIENGGALDINAQTMNGWGSLKISGTGVTSSGAFYNTSSTESSISVPIILTAASTIKSSGTGGLILSGNIENGGYTLTIDGDNNTTISGAISGAGDFIKSGEGTLTFSGAGELTFNNFEITAGKVAGRKNMTVNGILNLAAANPDDTNGLLDMVNDYGYYATGAYSSDGNYNANDRLALTNANPALKNSTSIYNNLDSSILTLGSSATIIGSGDVTGKIRRTSFVSGTTYAFGNKNTQLKFTSESGSALPGEITVVATRGTKGNHVDKQNTVKRLFQILRTGGASGTRFTVRFPYEESELNGNTTEDNIITWDHHIPYNGVTPHEHGKTSNNTTDNYVELANHGLYYLAEENDPEFTKYWMISTQVSTTPTWLGATNGGSWTSASNWSSGEVPLTNTSIIIPNDNITAFEPNITGLGTNITLGTIEIQEGAIVNAGDKTITLTGGPAINGGRGTWINHGDFNAGTGTVVFENSDATISGTTTFNNFTINANKKVAIQAGASATVTGTITNNSSSTIEINETGLLKVNNFTLTENFTFTNNGTLEVLQALTDERTSKNFGGLVRYAATSGSQSVVGGTYNHLDLTAAATKSFSANPTVAGNFTVAGGAVTAPTLFNFNGASAQNIAGLDYNNIEFSGNGNKTITSNASINGTSEITFGSGTATIDLDGDDTKTFVLKSDASGTARVGNVGGFTLNGKVTAERHMPARRAWRFLTAPLKGGSNNSIASNWRGTNGEGLLLFSPATYLGQTMTGYTLGGGSPNILKFSNGAWVGIPDITATNTLFNDTNNEPYLVFAVGPTDSQNIASSTGATATTLRPKGNLITGDVTHSLTANVSKLISNPYASPINPVSLLDDNTTSKIWLLDPTLGLGAYITYDGTNWSTTPDGNDCNIQSGQGFFVRATETTTFTIKETHKVNGNSNNWFSRTANENQSTDTDKIRVQFYKQENSIWKLADGILAVNSSTGNNDVDDKDANKISNFNENILFRNGTRNLSIEYRALPQPGNTQPMYLTATTAIPYQLRIFTENYSNSTLVPYLENTQNGTLTAIPTDGSVVTVPFTGVASSSTNPDMRFRIVYQNTLSNENNELLQVGVYPNPVEDGQLNIHLKDNTTAATFTISNLLGQEVQVGKLTNIQNNIQLKNTAQGVYLLKIKQEDKVFTTKLYIK